MMKGEEEEEGNVSLPQQVVGGAGGRSTACDSKMHNTYSRMDSLLRQALK